MTSTTPDYSLVATTMMFMRSAANVAKSMAMITRARNVTATESTRAKPAAARNHT